MIGYLGPKGTFTHIALSHYVNVSNYQGDTKAFNSVFSLFQALLENQLTHILVPVENSYGGDVYSAYEGLNNMDDSFGICYELYLTIHQSLISNQFCDIADITCLYAHEQSLRQCREFIESSMPNTQIIACSSNAQAAIMASKSTEVAACLGHKQLAKFYELQVLKERVNDHYNNKTRFVVISANKTAPTGNDKTSFVCSSLKDRPGSLVDMLSELANKSINLTRISSRPQKQILGEYIFFIDCVGHSEDVHVKECLEKIKNQSSYYKYLGSYKEGENYD